MVLLLLAALGCNGRPPAPAVAPPGDAGPVWFRDVTAEVGLDFTHDAGPADGRYFLPQVIGSGAALFDCDGDGRLDILLLQNAGPNSKTTHRLFRQTPDGRFADISRGSGLDVAGHGMGVAVGDVNNDGRPDVVITEYRGLRLFLNEGGGRFREVTREAGLDSPLWGTSASFLDYDRDGWLDLVVVNYVDYDPALSCADPGGRREFCHPNNFRPSTVKLYRNRGRPGSVAFEDVTLAAGLGRWPGPGLGVACADFTGDGWPDILVANDAKANHLFVNRRDGTFQEEALARGLAYNGGGSPQGNMGIALADVDGDGALDVFITHLTEEQNTLWLQRPLGSFQDRTLPARLGSARWRGTGFGTVLADFDRDGWPDLAVANGRVARRPGVAPRPSGAFWDDYAERNQLFMNEGNGRFRDVSPANPDFTATPRVARGLAAGDLDGDGAIDLLVTSVAGPAKVYRNVAPNRGHWLLVQAIDPTLKRDAYGAVVTVEAGGRRWVNAVLPGQSYLCSNDPRVHFGLGAAGRVDRIRVVWPDGRAETFPGGAADRVIVLRRGDGQPADAPGGAKP